jgi:hypothetical protein
MCSNVRQVCHFHGIWLILGIIVDIPVGPVQCYTGAEMRSQEGTPLEPQSSETLPPSTPTTTLKKKNLFILTHNPPTAALPSTSSSSNTLNSEDDAPASASSETRRPIFSTGNYVSSFSSFLNLTGRLLRSCHHRQRQVLSRVGK